MLPQAHYHCTRTRRPFNCRNLRKGSPYKLLSAWHTSRRAWKIWLSETTHFTQIETSCSHQSQLVALFAWLLSFRWNCDAFQVSTTRAKKSHDLDQGTWLPHRLQNLYLPVPHHFTTSVNAECCRTNGSYVCRDDEPRAQLGGASHKQSTELYYKHASRALLIMWMLKCPPKLPKVQLGCHELMQDFYSNLADRAHSFAEMLETCRLKGMGRHHPELRVQPSKSKSVSSRVFFLADAPSHCLLLSHTTSMKNILSFGLTILGNTICLALLMDLQVHQQISLSLRTLFIDCLQCSVGYHLKICCKTWTLAHLDKHVTGLRNLWDFGR